MHIFFPFTMWSSAAFIYNQSLVYSSTAMFPVSVSSVAFSSSLGGVSSYTYCKKCVLEMKVKSALGFIILTVMHICLESRAIGVKRNHIFYFSHRLYVRLHKGKTMTDGCVALNILRCSLRQC